MPTVADSRFVEKTTLLHKEKVYYTGLPELKDDAPPKPGSYQQIVEEDIDLIQTYMEDDADDDDDTPVLADNLEPMDSTAKWWHITTDRVQKEGWEIVVAKPIVLYKRLIKNSDKVHDQKEFKRLNTIFQLLHGTYHGC